MRQYRSLICILASAVCMLTLITSCSKKPAEEGAPPKIDGKTASDSADSPAAASGEEAPAEKGA